MHINIYFLAITTLFIAGCGNATENKIPIKKISYSDNHQEYRCDQVIDKEVFKICYNYSLKSPVYISYNLNREKINELNIEERPYFYTESTIDKEFSTNYSDYTGSGYDRGHLASDASFDYSQSSLNATYSMANITPQVHNFNAGMWLKLENYSRQKTIELENIEVKIAIIFDENPQTIGESQLAVPMGFIKGLQSFDKSYLECFYFDNLDIESSDLEDFSIDCSRLENSFFEDN